jgi:hypothetical protein
LCLRYHPDIAREEGAVEKFQELQEAYRVLAGDGEGALDVRAPGGRWSGPRTTGPVGHAYNEEPRATTTTTAGGSDRPLDDLARAFDRG